MLRFITKDDDAEALEKTVLSIRKVMMPYDYDYKISKFTSYNEEFKRIIRDDSEQKVYILDIEMPIATGIEIASEIRESGDWESMILFVSAYPEFKDEIFYSRLMAIDFVSKFHQYEMRLEGSLEKVLDIYNRKNTLIFNYNYITYRVPINKILYIEKVTANKKCIIATENGEKFEIISTLKDLMKKLTTDFYQSHKACVVNVKQISQVDYVEGLITFYNNEQINLLSARCKKGLRKYVGEY